MENGIPESGDVVWLNFNPQAGREQAGRRPGLVISPLMYNRFGLMFVAPITNQVKGYPFEIPIPDGCAISGVILADQLRTVDWRSREAQFECQIPKEVIEELKERLRPVFGY